jgi:glyoxylase-like metal-dependent hydrolase (beta-lactamase superfamily II)
MAKHEKNESKNHNNLKAALKNQGISPDDIDIVFITHWHRDHFGNIGLFKNAHKMISLSSIYRFGIDGFTGIDDGEELTDGVKVISTGGHTIDHASVIVETKLGDISTRVTIAGDAIISLSYFQSGKIWCYNADFFNKEVAYKSMVTLINLSDIIIPGHGVPFMTYSPEWVEKWEIKSRK